MSIPNGSRVPANPDEARAQARNIVLNLQVLRNHAWNFFGDREVTDPLDRALERLAMYDLDARWPGEEKAT